MTPEKRRRLLRYALVGYVVKALVLGILWTLVT